MTGRVLVEEEADRHDLEVAADGRDDHRPLAAVDRDGPLMDAEHVRDRVAVDVGVENARLLPERRERRGEVRRERRLADAALAARDGEHPRVRASTEIPGVRSVTPPRRRVVSAAFSSGVITSNAELDLVDALEGQQRASTCSWKLARSGQPATVRAIDSADAPAVDRDVAHHVELDRPSGPARGR